LNHPELEITLYGHVLYSGSRGPEKLTHPNLWN